MFITKQSSIRERVVGVMEYYNLNKHTLAVRLDTSDTNVKNYITDRDPSYEFLAKMISTFVEINPEWLMTGKGEMLKKEYQKKFIEERLDDIEEALSQIINILSMKNSDNNQKEIKKVIEQVKKEHPEFLKFKGAIDLSKFTDKLSENKKSNK